MLRIHSNINTTRTVSGRLASSDPNLQNIPARSEEGRKIRACFKAREGCTLVCGDYSQIEMRTVAHESDDPEMARIFKEKLDIHTQTASKIFGISYKDVTATEENEMKYRYPAKQVGFGMLFQLTAEGLFDQMVLAGAKGWTVEKCDNLIKEWFKLFKNIGIYFGTKRDEARRYGYVRDMFGRKYLIPQIKSGINWIVDEGNRLVCSYPVQGGAAGIMKRGMVNCKPLYKSYRDMGFIANPIIPIHDDMVWEVSEEIAEDFAIEFKWIMENALINTGIQFKVPIVTELKIGPVWGEMKKFKPENRKAA